MAKKKEEMVDVIPLFDNGTDKKAVEKKKKKKLKPKIWIYIKGWTRGNAIFSIHEATETDINKFSSLVKAINAYKDKENNWNADVTKVYEKYPKIKPALIDEFEAYVPTGIDLCYMDESRHVIQPGGSDSIDSITIIRGTEEEIL